MSKKAGEMSMGRCNMRFRTGHKNRPMQSQESCGKNTLGMHWRLAVHRRLWTFGYAPMFGSAHRVETLRKKKCEYQKLCRSTWMLCLNFCKQSSRDLVPSPCVMGNVCVRERGPKMWPFVRLVLSSISSDAVHSSSEKTEKISVRFHMIRPSQSRGNPS